jgi:hypothetical protein
MTEVKWKCSICRKPYTGFGNSAEPVKQGYCCDGCNESVLIRTRFAQLGFIDLAELKIARPTRH